MKAPQWVLRETVLALQERLLAEFGGLGGVRDGGLPDSALARPQRLFAHGQPSLFDLAAAYAFGLVRNHPFLDGNKRVGFTVAVLFLELNGRRFAAPDAEAALKTLALAARELDEAGYAAWLGKHSRKALPDSVFMSGRKAPVRQSVRGPFLMIKEHDCVVLTKNVPEEGLEAGRGGQSKAFVCMPTARKRRLGRVGRSP